METISGGFRKKKNSFKRCWGSSQKVWEVCRARFGKWYGLKEAKSPRTTHPRTSLERIQQPSLNPFLSSAAPEADIALFTEWGVSTHLPPQGFRFLVYSLNGGIRPTSPCCVPVSCWGREVGIKHAALSAFVVGDAFCLPSNLCGGKFQMLGI